MDENPHIKYPDDNFQFFLLDGPLDRQALYPWIALDSWDTDTACKLIILGYPADLQKKYKWLKEYPESWGYKNIERAIATYEDALTVFNSAVTAGKVTASDTPENWLAWAKRKGFKTDHLDSIRETFNSSNCPSSNKNENQENRFHESVQPRAFILYLVELIKEFPRTNAKQRRRLIREFLNGTETAKKEIAHIHFDLWNGDIVLKGTKTPIPEGTWAAYNTEANKILKNSG